MNVYVRRRDNGEIEMITSHPYEDEYGPAAEELPDNHPEVVEFMARKSGDTQ